MWFIKNGCGQAKSHDDGSCLGELLARLVVTYDLGEG